MNISLVLFYLPLTIIILSVVIAVLVIAYSPILKKIFQYRENQANYKADAIKEANQIIDNSRNQAARLLEESGKKAEENIKSINTSAQKVELDSENLLREIASRKNEELKRLSDELLTNYKSSIQQTLTTELNEIKSLSPNLAHESEELTSALKEAMNTAIQDSIKVIQNRILNEWEVAQNDIKQFKLHQQSLIEKRASDAVSTIVKETLGRTLDSNDHKEIIKNALSNLEINENLSATSQLSGTLESLKADDATKS